jgi:EAL domain-containing protein (putative c-di-GMP-specific phosphodiesterase class I)
LPRLQELDVNALKIDGTFTARLGTAREGKAFFAAIIAMAHALGMRVVAEGVENERQIELLKALHCDEMQGYYISRPSPADAAPA